VRSASFVGAPKLDFTELQTSLAATPGTRAISI
jgi:hypothetical protein